MSPRGPGLVLAVAIAVGCRRDEKAPPAVPDPLVTWTPTSSAVVSPYEPAGERTWTPVPERSAPTPVLFGSTIEVPVRSSPTPIDIGAIPNFDRPRDPTPASRAEHLARCLSYQITLDSAFSSSRRVRLVVRARNACGEWIPPADSRFEVVSKPVYGGGTAGRELGYFQTAIPPNSASAETIIEIDCPAPAGGCQYTASVWGAAPP